MVRPHYSCSCYSLCTLRVNIRILTRRHLASNWSSVDEDLRAQIKARRVSRRAHAWLAPARARVMWTHLYCEWGPDSVRDGGLMTYLFTIRFAFCSVGNNCSSIIMSPIHVVTYSIDVNLCLCIHFIHQWHYNPYVGPWPLLQFRNLLYADGKAPWTGDQPVARPLPKHRTIETQNKRTNRHLCLEWDSNPRSQVSCEWRQYVFV
jgi:hypothetical protein